MEMTDEQLKDLRKAKSELFYAQTNKSQPWESCEKWQEIICKPITDYGLAPREAKAILRACGLLTEHKIDPCEFLLRAINLYFAHSER